MAPMQAYTVDSDDEDSLASAQTHRSQSSRGSSRVENAYYAQYTGNDMCGATFAPGQGVTTFICFSPVPCRRAHHKTAAQNGQVGCYYLMKTSTKGFYDGVLSSWISAAEYQGIEAEERDSDGRALQGLGRAKTAAIAATTPASSGRTTAKTGGWRQTIEDSAAGSSPFGNSKEDVDDLPSPSAADPLGGGRNSVQFQSPIGSTSRGSRAQKEPANNPPLTLEEPDNDWAILEQELAELKELKTLAEARKRQEIQRHIADLKSELQSSTSGRATHPKETQKGGLPVHASRKPPPPGNKSRHPPDGKSSATAFSPGASSDSEDSLVPVPLPPPNIGMGYARESTADKEFSRTKRRSRL